jgi:hypothetical protein
MMPENHLALWWITISNFYLKTLNPTFGGRGKVGIIMTGRP